MNTPGTAVPLWRQLQATASVIEQVRAGTSATPALAAVEPALRAGVQALAFQTMRQLGRAEALRRRLAPRTPPPPADALLCTALALCWRAEDAPYEAFTLVDQAVEAAKRHPATRGQTGFINACLRRFLREQPALVAATDSEPVAHWNHPRWWIERLRHDHPRHWQAILQAANTQPPMTLRVNARKSTPALLLQAWAAMQVEARPVGEHGLVLTRPRPVHEVPGFDQGQVSVQDAAAQLAAPLLLRELDGMRPLRLLDACAAPGGKTAHLRELAGDEAELIALDVDPARCERIRETLARLGLAAQVVAADAAEPSAWWDGQPFDGILLDAPCTASGIVRRHPDVRWLRREADVARLAALQARLLDALWPLLRPGGRLLYCTCSVFRAEGEAQIQSFVAHNTDAALRPAPGHLIPQTGANPDPLRDNLPGDHDGFFYALLEKRRQPGGRLG
ncbi:16S rRNA (cytosine(967)-C(5))-methyltransferase RsmB [Ramlibacter tataouinensis]|uniref:16S rRNA (cytosine(967)-C(5))-methyltransferase n=1 Tax=Ramlibacter tataouinensis (strain ATCC BAA-407 / DSM 14655 / LMG 21543 / TTB310) TaxID=365046 RepID=F5Y0T7_RAMTT|nr:16S rRNA (cytosine(967)-C(5))-methyltransferase RsmB [Ramlibacter tataouinensis]AEG94681.1 16S rRNA m5C967 methyltransferase-like protein [Ramlibacter tataouinensis TTB310]